MPSNNPQAKTQCFTIVSDVDKNDISTTEMITSISHCAQAIALDLAVSNETEHVQDLSRKLSINFSQKPDILPLPILESSRSGALLRFIESFQHDHGLIEVIFKLWELY